MGIHLRNGQITEAWWRPEDLYASDEFWTLTSICRALTVALMAAGGPVLLAWIKGARPLRDR